MPTLFDHLLMEPALLGADQWKELKGLPEASATDPRTLGKVLLQRGWLTRFQINEVAAGRAKGLRIGVYVVLDRLGEGGMGQVFKARHEHMDRVVALKLMHKEKLQNPDSVARFYQEVKAAAALIHPNIVLAFDAGQAGPTHFFSMEYVEGTDLARLVEQHGPLSVTRACDCIRQAALGLQHAHERGMVHRDVKPSNLLVSQANGQPPVVKVLDMGLARLGSSSFTRERQLTRMGQMLGTPDYLAPEQALDARSVDIRADIYSLGCTLFFLLVGRAPFQAEALAELLMKHQTQPVPSVRELRSDVPEALDSLLRRMMAKKPEQRPAAPAEVASALDAFVGTGRPGAPAALTSALPPASNEVFADLTTSEERALVRPAALFARGQATVVESPRNRRQDREEKKSRLPVLIGAGVAAGVLLLGVIALGTLLLAKSRPDRSPVEKDGVPVAGGKNGKPGEEGPPKPGVAGEGPEKPPVFVPPAAPPPAAPQAGAVRSVAALRTFQRAQNTLFGGAFFSADGSRAILAMSQRILVLDLQSGALVRGKPLRSAVANRMALSRDRKHALAGTFERELLLIDCASDEPVKALLPKHDHIPRCFAVSADARFALSAGGNFQIQGGKVVYSDLAVRLWNLRTGTLEHRFTEPTKTAGSVALTDDGKYAVASSSDQEIRVWELDSKKLVHTIPTSFDRRPPFEIAPAGNSLVLIGTGTGQVWLLDCKTGNEVRSFTGKHEGLVTGLVVSANGRMALTVGGANKVVAGKLVPIAVTMRLWNVERGVERVCLNLPTMPRSVDLSPDGKYALIGDHDTVHYVELAKLDPGDGAARVVVNLEPGPITQLSAPAPPARPPLPPVAPAPGAGLFLGHKGLARGRIIIGHDGPLTSLGVSGDGKLLASGSKDRTVRVWSLSTGFWLLPGPPPKL